MVQALINNLNTPTVTSTPSSMSDCTAAKTNFQTLFDKQNVLEKEKASTSKESQEVPVMTLESKESDKKNETDLETTSEQNIEEAQAQTLVDTIQNIISQAISREENTDASGEESGEVEEVQTAAAIQNNDSNTNFNISLNNLEINSKIKPEAPTIIQTKAKDSENTETKSINDIVDEDVLQELKIESITSKSANEESGSDLMQNQTPQEQGVKAIIQTDADFTEVKPEIKSAEVSQGQETNITAKTSPNKIVEQISKHMEKLFNGSKLEMVLNPESLGKVSIQLINTKEGLSAQFTVATQEARNLIMKGLDGLKDTLLSHGVNVDNVSVKLNDAQESEYNSDWTEQDSSNEGNKQQNKKQEQRDKKQFEQTMTFVEEENGKV